MSQDSTHHAPGRPSEPAPGAAVGTGTLGELVALAALVAGAPQAALSRPGREGTTLHCRVGDLPARVPRDATPCGHVVARGQPATAAVRLGPDAAPAADPAHYVGVPVPPPRGQSARLALCVLNPAASPPPKAQTSLASIARVIGRVLSGRAAARRAHRAAARAEARTEAFLSAPSVVAWIKSEDGRMVYLSPSFLRIFDVEAERLLNRRDEEWMPAASARQTRAADQRVLDLGRPEELVEYVPTFDGRLHEWLSYKFPLREGRHRRVGGIAIDRTVERDGQRALAASRRSFQLLVEGLDEGVFELDASGNLTYLNPAWEQLTAVPAAEALGRPLVTFFAPRARPAQAAALLALCAGTIAAVDAKVPLPRRRGTRRRWLALRCARISGAQTSAQVVGSLREVTDEVRAARAERRLRRQLRERVAARTRELRAVVEGVPQLIWRAAADGTPNWFNPQWVAYTGIDRAGASVSPRQLVRCLVHSDDRHRALVLWRRARTAPAAVSENLRLRRADGAMRYFLVALLAVRGRDGQLLSWFGSCTDNELHMRGHAKLEHAVAQRTRTLSAQARELERSNRELQSFAQVISHDLREPLRMVTSFARLLIDRHSDVLDAEARQFVDFMVDGATRMQLLVGDLLAYARTHRGALAEQVPLDAVLAEVRATLGPTLAETGGQITATGPLPALPGTRVLFVQLLQNLCANAVKFRRPGVPPSVEIAATEDPEHDAWRVTVRDNGIGIAAPHLERIFVIFARLHTREAYEGTGVGLAICKKIVDQAGGRIWAESRVGAGTTVSISWPRAARTEPSHG